MQNVPQKVVIIVGNIKNHYAKEYQRKIAKKKFAKDVKRET